MMLVYLVLAMVGCNIARHYDGKIFGPCFWFMVAGVVAGAFFGCDDCNCRDDK